ncbi:Uncharacterised protein [Chlamydia abortus]|nr:Uncharacterised protein [Chlamydia abortus]
MPLALEPKINGLIFNLRSVYLLKAFKKSYGLYCKNTISLVTVSSPPLSKAES